MRQHRSLDTGPHLHFSSNRPGCLADLAPALPQAALQRVIASAAWLLQPALLP